MSTGKESGFRPGEEIRSRAFSFGGQKEKHFEGLPEASGKASQGSQKSHRPLDGKQESTFTIIFYPMGEKHGAHCTYFIRAAKQTQQIFAFRLDGDVRCAAHEWMREGAWGFPLFGQQVVKKGPINISLELLGPIPPVRIIDDVANWKFEREQVDPFARGEEVRSPPFQLQGIDLSIYYYPKGTKEGDGAHLAIFLKSSHAFAAQMCVDLVGPRSLSHDGRGVWGYPNFCATTLPDSLIFKVEVLCWRDLATPRRLHVSRSLCQQANLVLPPPTTLRHFPPVGVLWLGGDAGSISRALMAWYFITLNVELYWCQSVDDDWEPNIEIRGIATGDDELIGMQDKLAERLGIPQNDPKTTWYRQHKYAQRIAVEPHYDDYLLVNGTLEAIMWAIERIGGFPAVVKIPLSDSSAGVSLVENEEDVITALKTTIGPASYWEEFEPLNLNDEMAPYMSYRYESPRQVLVERLFHGTEYVVNCVSVEGVHCVSDCWVSNTKIPEQETRRPLYDTQSLVDIPDDVFNFTVMALDRCGVRYGASHLELIRCDNGECRLIELNARLAGDFPRAHNCSDVGPGSPFLQKVGTNQFSLLTLSIVKKEEFISYAEQCRNRPLPLKENVTSVFLRSPRDCKLLGSGLASLCMLPTFNGLRRAMGHLPVPAPFHPLKLALHPDKGNPDPPRFAAYGSSVLKTMSLRTCPGVVLLRSRDEERIREDVKRIRELEDFGIYGENGNFMNNGL